uniref:Uncharacterized protein n=1 Tax=Acrobeloides nanus TaxID=290746 RepID=A0A914E167_9BILA
MGIFVQDAFARVLPESPLLRAKRQDSLSNTAYAGQDTPFTQGAQPYNPYLYQSVPAGSTCAGGVCTTGVNNGQYQYNPPSNQYQQNQYNYNSPAAYTYADQTNNLGYVYGQLQREPTNNPNNFLYSINHPSANCNIC